MTFKDNLPLPGLARLAGFEVLELDGVDAGRFAQAQFMNDVALLSPGKWQWNGWLSAKGRVLALFLLLRVAEQRYWLVLPDVPAGAFGDSLRHFVFRSKLTIRARTDVEAWAGTDPGTAHADAGASGPDTDADCWQLDLSGAQARRGLTLAASDLASPADAGASALWYLVDMAHGLPRLSAAQADAWTPQMLSLDRLRAYSLRKGCYPGQEIVARTHYLGKAKRGLVRLVGDGLAEGAELVAGGVPVGQLIGCSADGREALAVARLDGLAGNLDAGGRACVSVDLAEGLQRPH